MATIDTFEERRSRRRSRKRSEEYRSAYMRDECRVVHCAGFRRLQGKTQVYSPDQSDYHRNRITHSLEVASISRSIIAYLRSKGLIPKKWLPNENLITAIGLLHDIGHPAFGHGGERALNFKMRDHGGFEGNAHTIRLLCKLEQYTDGYGLDLSRRTVFGILKYPAPYNKVCKKNLDNPPHKNRCISLTSWKPPKCYFDCDQDIVDWLISNLSNNDKKNFIENALEENPKIDKHGKTRFKTLDCSIMNLADDISNTFHDIEDAIYLRLITQDEFKKIVDEERDLSDIFNEEKISALFSGNEFKRKEIISKLITKTIKNIEVIKLDFSHPILKYNIDLKPKAKNTLKALDKNITKKFIINSPKIQSIDYGGALIVSQLFDAISSNPDSLLPEKPYLTYFNSANGITEQKRVICDYIANMTDRFALRLHARLFRGQERSIFDDV